MKISELGRALDVSVETIRYYEREGLLPAPARTASNYRSYAPAYAERLRFILNCRALDMTLQEIRALLAYHDRPTGDCTQVSRILDEHLGHVARRMTELRRLDGQLRRLRQTCGSGKAGKDCGILASLKQHVVARDRSGVPAARAKGL